MTTFDPRMLVKSYAGFYQMLRAGMAGMVGEQDIQAPAVISGLTPGTAYVFQARAVINNGYSDYSQPITKIAV